MEIEMVVKSLELRLDEKRKEYSQMNDYFMFTTTKERSARNYERNAIGELSTMLQLSAAIRELEYVLSTLRAYCPNEPTA